jgi:hypothetical protein
MGGAHAPQAHSDLVSDGRARAGHGCSCFGGGRQACRHARHVSGIEPEESANLTQFCGFAVSVFHEVDATLRAYPDGSERDTVNESFTYTAGPQRLFERDTFQFFFDAGQEISRFTGVPFRIQDESGRIIFKDRGNVAFDRDGNVFWEHGPHPSVHDTSGRTICDDLLE